MNFKFLIIIILLIASKFALEIGAKRAQTGKIKYCGPRFDQWRDKVSIFMNSMHRSNVLRYANGLAKIHLVFNCITMQVGYPFFLFGQ